MAEAKHNHPMVLRLATVPVEDLPSQEWGGPSRQSANSLKKRTMPVAGTLTPCKRRQV